MEHVHKDWQAREAVSIWREPCPYCWGFGRVGAGINCIGVEQLSPCRHCAGSGRITFEREVQRD